MTQVLPPEIDNRYEIGDLLGTGGSGAVYKAHDRQAGSAVAVKILHSPLASRDARVRFEREVKAHERLRGQPGIVQVHDHGVVNDRGWLVMDRHDVTLRDRLATVGHLSPSEAIKVLRQCAQAVAAIHRANMLHRDIKPSNIFIDPAGQVVLADLGVARVNGESTLTGLTPMSLQWAAPETIETGESTVATDLYSLGATAFTMLSGKPPFDLTGSDTSGSGSLVAVGPALRLIASGERPALSGSIPAGLRSLVDDMISVDPANRPESAAVVIQRLDAIDKASEPEAAIKNGRIATPVLLAGVLLIAMVVAGVAWLSTRSAGTTEVAVVEQTVQDRVEASTETPAQERADQGAGDSSTTTSATATEVPAVVDEPAEVAARTCGITTAVWCEPASLTEWDLLGDPAVAAYSVVDTDVGAGFYITPGDVSGGGYWAEQSLRGLATTDVVALRFRVLFEDVPLADDPEFSLFQSIASVTDERGRQWNVNLTNSAAGGLLLNAGFSAPPDSSGGATAPLTPAADTWHCVELVLDSSNTPAVELLVNDESVISLTDVEAAQHGAGFSLSVGPRWLEYPELAPNITIADIAVGTQRVGCDFGG